MRYIDTMTTDQIDMLKFKGMLNDRRMAFADHVYAASEPNLIAEYLKNEAREWEEDNGGIDLDEPDQHFEALEELEKGEQDQ